MRRADEATISSGTPTEVLMERAGRAVAREVIAVAGGRYGKKVAVVCGKGNNGGDGFAAARLLHGEGLGVTCVLVWPAEEAKGPAAHHLRLLRRSGCRIVGFGDHSFEVDVIVDAVLGTGSTGEPKGPARDAIAAMTHAVQGEEVEYDEQGALAVPAVWPIPRLVSVDVPSAGWVPADIVVALGAEKLQTFFAEPERPMEVRVADIGIEVEAARVAVIEERDVALQLPEPLPGDHKTSRGRVLILAGSNSTTGAAILSARSAARMGSGYVTLASTAGVIDAAETLVPEVLKRRLPGEALGPQDLDELTDVLERADCVALGPGLGVGNLQRDFVARVLREFGGPVVVDADGLNNLVGRTEILGGREWPVVITPHVAEMGRLLERPTPEISRDRLGSALEAAERFGCTVVLKGHRSIVAGSSLPGRGLRQAEGDPSHPDEAAAIAIPVGGPELATAGTGDVLTGAVAAQLARGGHPLFIVAAACYVHGIAGSLASLGSGRTGVVAWDVAEALPQAIERIRGPYAGRTCL
jgi:NAD(P)H-hydrate epimerase